MENPKKPKKFVLKQTTISISRENLYMDLNEIYECLESGRVYAAKHQLEILMYQIANL